MDFDPAINFYATIGVAVDADVVTIRKACRKRLRELHPDRGGASDDVGRFTEVVEAKRVLLDPDLRIAYDEHLKLLRDAVKAEAQAAALRAKRLWARKATGLRLQPKSAAWTLDEARLGAADVAVALQRLTVSIPDDLLPLVVTPIDDPSAFWIVQEPSSTVVLPKGSGPCDLSVHVTVRRDAARRLGCGVHKLGRADLVRLENIPLAQSTVLHAALSLDVAKPKPATWKRNVSAIDRLTVSPAELKWTPSSPLGQTAVVRCPGPSDNLEIAFIAGAGGGAKWTTKQSWRPVTADQGEATFAIELSNRIPTMYADGMVVFTYNGKSARLALIWDPLSQPARADNWLAAGRRLPDSYSRPSPPRSQRQELYHFVQALGSTAMFGVGCLIWTFFFSGLFEEWDNPLIYVGWVWFMVATVRAWMKD